MRHRALVFIAIAALAVGLAACGSSAKSSSGSNAVASGSTITIQNFSFTPATVKAGTTVTVDNKDSVTHTVTADAGAFNTGNVDSGKTATFTAPTKPGTYAFHCNIHTTMHGTLTVTA